MGVINMKKNRLGKTGIEVSELCFGVLPIGPLQKNVPVKEAAETISLALENGINFLDTAQMYKTYPHIKLALEKTKIRPVIASKSTAKTYEEMECAINEALEMLGLDYIDIFHLHGARADVDVFEVRKGALECLLDYKKKGIIKGVGIATHNVKVVELASNNDDIDIVFPLINKAGRGILKGSIIEMEEAIKKCVNNDKGVYLMKVLGGGTLIDDYDESMKYGRGLGTHSIAVGMVSKEEVLYNIKYFNNEKDIEELTTRNKKNLTILKIACAGCGKCIEVCHSEAIDFDAEGKAHIDTTKCLQCGYCIAQCPEFCIRII